MSERESDPVVQNPLFFELEDGQKQVFVDVFQALPEAKALGVKRLGYERLELFRSLHSAITLPASVLARPD